MAGDLENQFINEDVYSKVTFFNRIEQLINKQITYALNKKYNSLLKRSKIKDFLSFDDLKLSTASYLATLRHERGHKWAELKLADTRTPKKCLSANFITPITPKIGYFFFSFTLFFLLNSTKSLLIPSGSKLALLSRIDIPSRY